MFAGSAPLKLIFADIAKVDGDKIKIRQHVAFYDLFGGIAEVDIPADGGDPELVISPINKYDCDRSEVLTLWIKPDEKEKIGQAVRELFDRHDDPLSAIFSGKQVKANDKLLTNVSFCVEALRTVFPILPEVPANCITIQKLYTVLRMMGGI